MRLIFLSICIIPTLNGCSQKTTEKSLDSNEISISKDKLPDESTECSSYYLFNDTLIDLKYLNTVLINSSENKPFFKECSKYKRRFLSEKFFFKLPSDSILKDQYCTYEFVSDFKVKITNPDYEVIYADFPKRWKEGDVYRRPYLISMGENDKGIVAVYEIPEESYFHLIKMNYDGEILAERKIEKIILDKNGKETGEHLYITDFSNKQLIFSSISHNDDHPKTIIVDLEGLMENVISFDKKLIGVAWDEKEEYVKGFIYDSSTENFEVTNAIYYYHSYFNLKDSATTMIRLSYQLKSASLLLNNNTLIIASYHPISTGSQLIAFDLGKGYQLWKAEVLQLNTGHSKYYNSVVISKYENKIIMEGNEAHGDYLQIFDFKTGRRLAEFGVVSKK